MGILVGWYVIFGSESNRPSTSTIKPTITQAPGAQGSSLRGGTGVGPTVQPTAMTTTTAGGGTKGGTTNTVNTVTYTNNGFVPSRITVKKGTTVSFVNDSAKNMWVASDVHPTHQLLPGFDQLKSVARGGKYDYTFAKIGTWKYHNHQFPADGGYVVVSQ